MITMSRPSSAGISAILSVADVQDSVQPAHVIAGRRPGELPVVKRWQGRELPPRQVDLFCSLLFAQAGPVGVLDTLVEELQVARVAAQLVSPTGRPCPGRKTASGYLSARLRTDSIDSGNETPPSPLSRNG